MTRNIIGFCGYMRSGKTTAAKWLELNYGYTILPFADPLKRMLLELGLTSEEVYGSRKETPSAILGGRTPRFAMKTLGTEWGRETITFDLWLRAWMNAAKKISGPIVVDDVRFNDEAATLKHMGGTIVRIARPGCDHGDHPSEQIDFPYDIELTNDSTIGDFHYRLGIIKSEMGF